MEPRTSIHRVAAFLLLASLGVAAPAHAQEVSLTVGRLLGDDLVDSDPGLGDYLPSDFSDATLFGVRASAGLVLVDVEGSLLIGNSALFEGTPMAVDARFTYLEGSAVVRLLPGPIAPFLAGGLGLHRISLEGPGDRSHTTLGYNIGAGLKVGLGSVGVRADLRDHITPLKVEDLSPDLAEALGAEGGTTLHDFEVSFGLTIHF